MAKTHPSARDTAEAWLKAIEDRDTDAFFALLDEDVELRVDSLDVPIVGRDALRALFGGDLAEMYERMDVEPIRIIDSGAELAMLVRLDVRMRSDLELLGETLATSGKDLSLVAALFMTVDASGRITRLHRVRDNWDIIRQLGIDPAQMERLMTRMEAQLRQMRSAA